VVAVHLEVEAVPLMASVITSSNEDASTLKSETVDSTRVWRSEHLVLELDPIKGESVYNSIEKLVGSPDLLTTTVKTFI